MDEMSRQGLMLWLKALVESGKCPGVSWVDQEKAIFKIPWSNQKSRNWNKEDSSVFLEYAKHTRKFKPDDEMDFPKWKQNLKSAINKNRFIERLTDMDRLCGPKPFRVYRFLSETNARKKSRDAVSALAESLVLSSQVHKIESSLKSSARAVFNESSILATSRTFSDKSAISCSGSESPFSPAESGIFECDMSLSPDIARSDLCDQTQGNIPVFVGELSDESNLVPVELNHELHTPVVESPLPGLHYITDGPVYLPSIQRQVQGTQVNIVQRAAGNISPNQLRLQAISVQAQPELSQSATAQQAVINTIMASYSRTGTGFNSHLVNSSPVEQPASHELSLMRDQGGHEQSGATILKSLSVQKGDITFKETADSNTGLQHRLASTRTDHRASELPPLNAEPTPSINTIATAECSNTSSLSELYGGYNSHLPCSMDTSEKSSINEDGQGIPGSTTDRENLISMCAPNLVTNHTHDDSVVHVQVLYGTPHRTVKKVTLTRTNNSCRLFFGSVNCSIVQAKIQGQQKAEEVELPAVDGLDYTEKTKNTIRKIIKDLELGILISYRDGNIYVERRCLPRVYYSDGVATSESLPRSNAKKPGVETKVFDLNKDFKEPLQRNLDSQGPVPKDHFILTVGYEIIPNDDSPTRRVPVYIVVRHVLAATERFQILGASTITPNPMCSDPNSFDKIVALFKDIDLKK